MQKYEHNLAAVVSGALRPITGAEVTVADKTTGLQASLYSDDGVTPLMQPLITDETGYFGFYAADGKYIATFVSPRFETFTREILLEDPDDDPFVTVRELAAAGGAAKIGVTGGGTLQEKLDSIPQNLGGVTSVNNVEPDESGKVAIDTDDVPEGGAKYFTDARVRGAVLAGLSLVTNAAITAADTVLGALGKLQKQVTDLVTAAATYTAGKLNFRNLDGTLDSFLVNANTVPRTYTFPDKDGTVALTLDIQSSSGGAMVLLDQQTVATQINALNFPNVFNNALYDHYVIDLSAIGSTFDGDTLYMRAYRNGALVTTNGLYKTAGETTSAAWLLASTVGSASKLSGISNILNTSDGDNSLGASAFFLRTIYRPSNGTDVQQNIKAGLVLGAHVSGVSVYLTAGQFIGKSAVRIYGIKKAA